MPGPRHVAVSAIGAVLLKGAYSDTVLDILIERDKTLNDADKALATELVYGVLRNLARLDHVTAHFSKKPLPSLDPEVLTILRVAFYQLMFLERVPAYAVCDEAVKLCGAFGKRSAGAFVNGVLRTALKGLGDVSYPDPDVDPISFVSIYYSLPRWLMEFFVAAFGMERAIQIGKHQVKRPHVVLRANALRGGRDVVMKKLEKNGISARGAPYSPMGIIVEKGGAIFRGDLSREGYFSIQDEASQLCALMLNPEPGGSVLDVCAAPGLKGTFFSELMEDRGSVLSVEINRTRAHKIAENRDRLGTRSLRVVVADAGRLPLTRDAKFDHVFVDPPCSALGILRRNPEIKWRLKKEDFEPLVKNQRLILEEAARYVKSGGSLVYCVCTINPDEGEKMIMGFLDAHDGFSLDEGTTPLGEKVASLTFRGVLFTPPFLFDEDDPATPDGFFAARIVKK
jgi:16S rRNA (cytosine967-C5)-methyltransferase